MSSLGNCHGSINLETLYRFGRFGEHHGQTKFLHLSVEQGMLNPARPSVNGGISDAVVALTPPPAPA